MLQNDDENKLDQICNLSHRLSQMSPGQKKIADFLRADPEIVSTLTITRLAHKIGVDPASITRFCQSLGFSGYSDFKFSITRTVVSPLLAENTAVEPGDTTARILSVGATLKQALGDTFFLLDRHAMARGATLLAEARTVHAYAHGGAAVSAQYAQTLFIQIGIPCYTFSDPSLSTAAASQLGKGDVAIGIASSGTSRVAVDAMTIAKKQGATVISISGFSNSLMGQLADVNISYHSRLKDDIRYMHMARICELAIIGVMQMLVLDTHSPTLNDRLKTVQRAIRQGRYSGTRQKKRDCPHGTVPK